jgi:hypothetical protein
MSVSRVVEMFFGVATVLIASDVANAQCTWRWNDPVSRSVNAVSGEHIVSNVGFDMLGYARQYAVQRGANYSSVSAYVSYYHAYGWRMKYYAQGRWIVEHFDMMDVARWQGNQNFGYLKVKNYGFQMLDINNPYSWRGCYILRR